MKDFIHLSTINSVDQFINNHSLSFIYISRPNCSICHSLLPQVQELMRKYPEIHTAQVDAAQLEEIAGKFSIFTVPVLLLFIEGKEYIREARIVHMDLLEEKLDKIYEKVVG
ncbi:thioredoxin [Oceanobacillus piezotolerans]|uniref:Thioredoxin n=1 Tax=Oceanobacillus piezotolerans TaxID=2448030 RepID=A0A498D2U8_9BACI|nr:thioredoxin family protein [Oceanobacillus piezotolerans]RLL42042.1 thioredoxin [Oceanobacillus piezotolerans]